MANKIKWPKHYSIDEIMAKYNKLDEPKKIKILEKALRMALDDRAGTREYAIASSLGYAYQDNGYYIK